MSEQSTIRAIETAYKGYRFRSRLEARWAVFFDTAGIEWEYEPEGYRLPDGTCYLPDFLLPEVGCRRMEGSLFVEVKGALTKEAREEAYRRADLLAESTGIVVALVVGTVHNGYCEQPNNYDGHYQRAPGWADDRMRFLKCLQCGRVKFEYDESNYYQCSACGGKATDEHPALLEAVAAARSTRFEHGEQP